MSEKKALIVATIAGFITSFEMNDIRILQDMGYSVSCATNMKNNNLVDRIEELRKSGVTFYDVPFARSPIASQNITAFRSLRKIMRDEKFNLVHCHTPVGGVLGRIAAHKEHVPRVIYTAHGFHFYKGAPLKNWIMFYPIEKFLSRWTDTLITINQEDYKRAKEKFHAKKTEYVPGVGIDTKKFILQNFDKVHKRKELGLSKNDTMILSIGELNDNKNHEVIIRAISSLNNNEKIHYFIAGKGDKAQYLENLAKELKVNLHLLGYRTDIAELLNCADIYAFPSKREGLSVALMEAMAAGLPIICSNIRGNVDLIENDINGYLYKYDDVDGFASGIREMLKKDSHYFINNSLNKIMNFDSNNVNKKMLKIYRRSE